jgi:hypothetical protein
MIIKHSLNNHKEHKLNLLKLIKEIPEVKSKESYEDLSKSDWYLPTNYKRLYWDYFINLLEPFKKEMQQKFGGQLDIQNYWFQQYTKNNFHNWHNHDRCHFSSVYYLELPSVKLITQFKNKLSFKAKEGDIITFPSYLFHRSPMNKTNKRKTVIVFNSSIVH